ncbi:hypothetical protein CLOM_g17892 [Closterium sp. NIES-68]|nr:hypothetical protein CLOM_g17892 [Closterium sp. NIES-68]
MACLLRANEVRGNATRELRLRRVGARDAVGCGAPRQQGRGGVAADVRPGYATNVRSQEQDTVVVVLRGEGALRFRPNHTDHVSPAPFESTPFRANSTVIIPRNTVHQLVNSSKKRLQFLHIFGKPPIRFREFASWEEAQGKKVFPGPFDRKCLPGSFFGGHRASPSQDM